MKKRIIQLVTLFLLVVGMNTTAFTESQMINEHFTSNQLAELYNHPGLVIRNIAEGQGNIYAYLSNSSICAWKISTDEMMDYCRLDLLPSDTQIPYDDLPNEIQEQWKNTVAFLFTDGPGLYGVNNITGRIGVIEHSGIKWSEKKIDPSLLFSEDHKWPYRVIKTFTSENKLYIYIAKDNVPYPHNNYDLVCYDLKSGASEIVDIDNAQGICCTGENTAIVLNYEGNEWVFREINLSTQVISDTTYHKVEASYDSPVGGLVYDKEQKILYYVSEGKVYAKQEGTDAIPVAVIPTTNVIGETLGFLLDESTYAVLDNRLLSCKLQQINSIETLHLSGCIDDGILKDFINDYPEVSVVIDERILAPDEIVNKLMTRDDNIDIYATCVDSTFVNLVRKGYAYPLIQSQDLVDNVSTMYPAIRNSITNEKGNPIAYPYQMYLCQWKINYTIWNEFFPEKEIPTTYSEFFQDMILWEDEYASEYPAISFAGEFSFSYWVKMIINAYETQYAVQDGESILPAPLTEPRVIEVLELIEHIRDHYVNGSYIANNSYNDQIFIPDGFVPVLQKPVKSNLLSLSLSELPGGIYISIPPLTFEEGKVANIVGQLYVWMINPFSKYKDLAIAYLEHAAKCDNNPLICYATHPYKNDPIPNEFYLNQYEELKAKKEMLLNYILEHQGEEGDWEYITSEIDGLEKEIQKVENRIWIISPEAISSYREIAPSICFYEDNPYVMLPGRRSNINTSLQDLYTKYETAIFDTSSFLDAFQGRMKMIQNEQ